MRGLFCRPVLSRERADIAAELGAAGVSVDGKTVQRWAACRRIVAFGNAPAGVYHVCSGIPGLATAGDPGRSLLLAGGDADAFSILARDLRNNGLSNAAAVLKTAGADAPGRILLCRGRRLSLSKTRVMGILNVTPDSFSDGGKYTLVETAVERALHMEARGAAVIDVGGESTRPGARAVPAREEAARVVSVIRALSKKLKKALISVDTCKSGVARAAFDAGAHMVNDISGMHFDKKMAGTAARAGAGAVLMHIKGTPRTMQKNPQYGHLVHEVYGYLAGCIGNAVAAGVNPRGIAVDPGIGFGKTVDHNLELMRRIRAFRGLGVPVLAGASRKSFIGITLGLPVEERLEGSLAAAVAAAASGARLVRVHDVQETCRAVALADAIYGGVHPL